MNKNFRFWAVYAAAWSAYAASLAAVFAVQGSRFERGTFFTILSNVAPAVLLGLLVVWVCSRYQWRDQNRPRFFFAHVFLAAVFAAAWCSATLLALSVLISLQAGKWIFNSWGSYAVQWQLFSGLMAYFTIASAVYVGQVGERLRREERRVAELETRAAGAEAARHAAELAGLRAQLNPHFLFNTLHSLMALVRTDAAAAEDALERFAAMLRYVLQAQQTELNNHKFADATFADEWRFVQSYLGLERLRLGDRLRLKVEIEPAALACRLPAFSLQPLIENAIKHAIAPRTAGGTLSIKANVVGDKLRLEVADDGAGANAKPFGETNGLGLRLVRKSLTARYDQAFEMTIETTPATGFTVRLVIPLESVTETGDGAGLQNAAKTDSNLKEINDRWEFAR